MTSDLHPSPSSIAEQIREKRASSTITAFFVCVFMTESFCNIDTNSYKVEMYVNNPDTMAACTRDVYPLDTPHEQISAYSVG